MILSYSICMATHSARVTDRGQVTIPKRVRDRLGIRPGALLEFDEGEAGELVARKVTTESALDRAYGILGLEGSSDQLMAEIRGEAEHR